MSTDKRYHQMNKEECVEFLSNKGIQINPKWSLTELREVVKEHQGSIEKVKTAEDPMSNYQTLKAWQLIEKCNSFNLAMSSKPTRGECLLRLRDYHEQQCNGETVMGFGQFKNLTFEEISQKHESYCQWAMKEYQVQGGQCNYRMAWFVQWLAQVKDSHLPQEAPEIEGQNEKENNPSQPRASSSSPASPMMAQLEEMSQEIKDLRLELSELKESNRCKTPASNASDEYSILGDS